MKEDPSTVVAIKIIDKKALKGKEDSLENEIKVLRRSVSHGRLCVCVCCFFLYISYQGDNWVGSGRVGVKGRLKWVIDGGEMLCLVTCVRGIIIG